MIKGQKDSEAGTVDKGGEDSLVQEGRDGKKKKNVVDTEMR